MRFARYPCQAGDSQQRDRRRLPVVPRLMRIAGQLLENVGDQFIRVASNAQTNPINRDFKRCKLTVEQRGWHVGMLSRSEAFGDHSRRALEKYRDHPALVYAQPVAIARFERRTREHQRSTAIELLINMRTETGEPRHSICIGQRNPCAHSCNVCRRMKVVSVVEFDAEPSCQRHTYRCLATAAHTANNDRTRSVTH